MSTKITITIDGAALRDLIQKSPEIELKITSHVRDIVDLKLAAITEEVIEERVRDAIAPQVKALLQGGSIDRIADRAIQSTALSEARRVAKTEAEQIQTRFLDGAQSLIKDRLDHLGSEVMRDVIRARATPIIEATVRAEIPKVTRRILREIAEQKGETDA